MQSQCWHLFVCLLRFSLPDEPHLAASMTPFCGRCLLQCHTPHVQLPATSLSSRHLQVTGPCGALVRRHRQRLRRNMVSIQVCIHGAGERQGARERGNEGMSKRPKDREGGRYVGRERASNRMSLLQGRITGRNHRRCPYHRYPRLHLHTMFPS